MLCNHVTRLEGNPMCSKVKDTCCSSKKKNTMHVLLIAVITLAVLVSFLVVLGHILDVMLER